MCKKKPKSEVVMPKDDLTFKIYRNRLLRARFRFLEKKKKKKRNRHGGGRLHL